jgi:hypothetical protein
LSTILHRRLLPRNEKRGGPPSDVNFGVLAGAQDGIAELFPDQPLKPAKSRCKPDIAPCEGIFADSLREIL